MTTFHVDCFSTPVDELRGKKLTYENVKASVLAAGRFSVFDATATSRHGVLFTQLMQDVELEFSTTLGYPWTTVRKREKPLCAKCRGAGKIEQLREVAERVCMVDYIDCDCNGGLAKMTRRQPK